jgi:sugar/nucleoside kinase (ribokinase family)
MTLQHATDSCKIDAAHNALCIKHGEKIDVDRFDFCMGGNATNVAVGLSRLGIKTGLCTEIGDDELSLKIRNWLVHDNIERLLIKQTTGAASSFAVIINYLGDRTIFVEDVEREHDFDFEEVTTPFVFLTSLGNEWKKPYHKVLDFVRANESMLAFNPGSRQLREGKDVVHEVLQVTNILFLNKEEAELLLFDKESEKRGREYCTELLTALQKLGPQTVVLTDGKHGSYARSDHQEVYHHGLTEGKIVERTGAGDGYTAGFIAASMYGLSVPKAMEWGSYNASSVVSMIGAEPGLLTKEQMEAKVNDSKPQGVVLPAPVE